MKKMLNEDNQIHNLYLVPVPEPYLVQFRFRLFNKLRFRFHQSKSYGSYGSGPGSTTLFKRPYLKLSISICRQVFIQKTTSHPVGNKYRVAQAYRAIREPVRSTSLATNGREFSPTSLQQSPIFYLKALFYCMKTRGKQTDN